MDAKPEYVYPVWDERCPIAGPDCPNYLECYAMPTDMMWCRRYIAYVRSRE